MKVVTGEYVNLFTDDGIHDIFIILPEYRNGELTSDEVDYIERKVKKVVNGNERVRNLIRKLKEEFNEDGYQIVIAKQF